MNLLEITASPTEITINRGYSPIEVYRLDGTATDFGNGYSGSAVLVGSNGVALTARRPRDLGGDRGLSTLVYTDLYRINGDVLTMESRRSQTQSDGSLINMPTNTPLMIEYRRTP